MATLMASSRCAVTNIAIKRQKSTEAPTWQCEFNRRRGSVKNIFQIRASSKVTQTNPSAKEKHPNTDLNCVLTGQDVECVVPEVKTDAKEIEKDVSVDLSCVMTGQDVECVLSDTTLPVRSAEADAGYLSTILETLLLVSPFFFWGTAMVAMKDVLPKAGPLFVASVRLIPAGALLVGFASWKGRKLPDSLMAWVAIAVFALVDATAFQGCLAEGLRRTSAGLGSVIIDSQPLTVAILAAILFGETIQPIGAIGLLVGVLGLCLLEVPVDVLQGVFSGKGFVDIENLQLKNFDLWQSGEWWMLLSAQSMAVGTVLVRWVCKYNDPVMATGWHMILGGIPLLLLSIHQQDPAISGHISELSVRDWVSLGYTSLFGSAVSYGVFFYNANKGNLTRLSSLTFLTPMFAALFGYLFLEETFNSWQLLGAGVTLIAIVLVNSKPKIESKDL